jgi:hypothetical protein
MQIKSIRYHATPNIMEKREKNKQKTAEQKPSMRLLRCGTIGTLTLCWWEYQMLHLLSPWQIFWRFLAI